MDVFAHEEFDGHEQVVFGHDRDSGLRTVIAIHNTNLGPALGGCRMWPYKDENEALTDALRLSRGMTYKAAMANLPLGGGKSVIIGDAKTDKTEALLKAFGRQVDHLNRRYITAEDVGTKVPDMDIIKTVTPHVVGVTGGAGNPSPSTAHGVAIGMVACTRHALKKDSLNGLRVAVQGAGNVGYYLCRYLKEAGATILVTDINAEAVQRCVDEFGATAVPVDEIYEVEAEIFAPCALGAVVNDTTIPKLKAQIIAGSANNILEDERHGFALRDRGILYAPDYVINAGGLIDVARFAVGFDIKEGRRKLALIDDTLAEIFQRGDAEGLPTSEVADIIAEERFGKR
jgi:leucine dehydrogenase